MLSWKNSSRNDGTAITTRITTGMTVQTTSSSVLCVVRDGVGLARALNRTMTMTSSTSTNAAMAVMIQSSRLWNETMWSITAVADCCSPSCHARRLPDPGQRRSRTRQNDGHRHCQKGQPLEHQHRPHCSFE